MSEYFSLTPPYFKHVQILVHQLQQNPEQTLLLEQMSYQDFSCSQCGECCRLPWGISIDKDYYEKWYVFFDQHPQFSKPFIRNPKGQQHNWAHIRRKENSSECLFLEPDQRCYIHKHHGESALSSICRSYPKTNKNIGYAYHVNYVLPSCKDVPKLLNERAAIRAKIFESAPMHPKISPKNSEQQFDRNNTYLWLGMGLDVLNAPAPDYILDRFFALSQAWEWMDAIGLKTITHDQIAFIYKDIMGHLPYCGFRVSSPEDLNLALQWGELLLDRHPGCRQWLQQLKQSESSWPNLKPNDHEMIEDYLKGYLNNRLLCLPYEDAFSGPLSLWQQCFLLGLQVLAFQILFLYFRAKHPMSPSEDHLIRAINMIGQTIIQNTQISEKLDLNSLNSAQCFEGIGIATSLNLAKSQVIFV